MLIQNNFRSYMQQSKVKMPQLKTLQTLSDASATQQKKFISNLCLEEFNLNQINQLDLLVCLMDGCEFKTLLYKVIALRQNQIFNRPQYYYQYRCMRLELQQLESEKKRKQIEQRQRKYDIQFQQRRQQFKKRYNDLVNKAQGQIHHDQYYKPQQQFQIKEIKYLTKNSKISINQVKQIQNKSQKQNIICDQAKQKAKHQSQSQLDIFSKLYQIVATSFKKINFLNHGETKYGQNIPVEVSELQQQQLLVQNRSEFL